jgi:hypothetical protein
MTPEIEKLHRLLNDAKCSLLLNNARKRVVHTISNEEAYYLEPEVLEQIVKNQMIQKLASEFVNSTYNKITKEDSVIGYKYSLDVIVIPREDLKMVVNYLIQNMELEDLLRIREYGKENNSGNSIIES